MNIYAEEGSKVRFLNKNGYDSDREYAIKTGLIEGETYTVKYVEVGGWSSSVNLNEFPNTYFNTVMFEDIEEEE